VGGIFNIRYGVPDHDIAVTFFPSSSRSIGCRWMAERCSVVFAERHSAPAERWGRISAFHCLDCARRIPTLPCTMRCRGSSVGGFAVECLRGGPGPLFLRPQCPHAPLVRRDQSIEIKGIDNSNGMGVVVIAQRGRRIGCHCVTLGAIVTKVQRMQPENRIEFIL
jgi:hypothetical protein